jgi:hypothetical protein
MNETTILTNDQLMALAQTAGDLDAANYVDLQGMGAMIVSRDPGWEVTYDPTTNANKPWTDDEGNRFATANVMMR